MSIILPTSPDALSLGATLQMVKSLKSLQNNNFKLLLTLVPPSPSTMGQEAAVAIEKAGLPLFEQKIRRFVAFQKAALEGKIVSEIKRDRYSQIAWRGYEEIGREIDGGQK